MDRDDPLELAFQVDRFMRRLNARVHAKAPVFDKERVGPIGGMVLMTIAEVQPATMQQIAAMMGRDKAQMSRTIAMLERRKLVIRTANAADQRSTLLNLTQDGEDFVVSIKHVVGGVLSELLEPLSESERAEMRRLLGKT